FRHNAASRMVRKGVPLPVISDGLGHNNPDSTMVYIATDHKTMASLTLRVPKAGDKV
ncbi:MAG: tyrosine-type recombinase/integrase, partial [Solobacterium sp.]|nr:tyrosine-type recombinase/integrase [Solobacterium sp.]